MLTELGHPFSRGEPIYDVTFENVQAGLRTDYLFRAANQRGGIVLGTGDLSELALGWCTYGVGDQMSHYNVNGGVPKTLIQHLIRWVVSSKQFDDEVGAVLTDVLDTEITPELVPTGEDEEVQSSEAKVGPYSLQDFTLFTYCATGSVPRRSPSWPGTPGTTRSAEAGRRASPRPIGSATRCRRSGTGSGSSPSASSRSASSSARLYRTVRRCPRADRCRLGVTGGHHRTCRRRYGWRKWTRFRSSGRRPVSRPTSTRRPNVRT